MQVSSLWIRPRVVQRKITRQIRKLTASSAFRQIQTMKQPLNLLIIHNLRVQNWLRISPQAVYLMMIMIRVRMIRTRMMKHLMGITLMTVLMWGKQTIGKASNGRNCRHPITLSEWHIKIEKLEGKWSWTKTIYSMHHTHRTLFLTKTRLRLQNFTAIASIKKTNLRN